MKILVTGATGFIGKAIATELITKNNHVVVSVRNEKSLVPDTMNKVIVGDLLPITDWSSALRLVSVVIHCAARTHIMNDKACDPLTAFRTVNTQGTLNLARQAAEAGVQRFVFISSVKANGALTEGVPFSPEDQFIPTDPYGLSKYEAEQGLLAWAKDTGMEVVIIRPPLVYGLGVKGNFANLMTWINRGVPMPFGAIHNQRSFVALDNLLSFIIHCIDHPKAANEVFLIADGEDVSTTVLLKKVAKAFRKRVFLLPIPVSLLTFVAKLGGKADVANRLFGSLQIDSSKAHDLLGWQPVITMDEQLKKTVEAYLDEKTV